MLALIFRQTTGCFIGVWCEGTTLSASVCPQHRFFLLVCLRTVCHVEFVVEMTTSWGLVRQPRSPFCELNRSKKGCHDEPSPRSSVLCAGSCVKCWLLVAGCCDTATVSALANGGSMCMSDVSFVNLYNVLHGCVEMRNRFCIPLRSLLTRWMDWTRRLT